MECQFDFGDTIGDSAYFAVTGMLNMRPRNVTVEASENGDGRYTIITADIDGDGVEETLNWDMPARDG